MRDPVRGLAQGGHPERALPRGAQRQEADGGAGGMGRRQVQRGQLRSMDTFQIFFFLN